MIASCFSSSVLPSVEPSSTNTISYVRSTDASAWLPTLRRGRGDWLQALESLGELYVRGAADAVIEARQAAQLIRQGEDEPDRLVTQPVDMPASLPRRLGDATTRCTRPGVARRADGPSANCTTQSTEYLYSQSVFVNNLIL